MSLTWVLEREVFPNGDCIRTGAVEAGHHVLDWREEWSASAARPELVGPVLFHGSLSVADRIARERWWTPGAYCDAGAFHCSAWYPRAEEWLLNRRWEILPAAQLVRERDLVLDRLGTGDAVFVRPDSPLKPFSGRVLTRDRVTLAALDHGFYYDDPYLPVVVAPLRVVLREWRYVVSANRVIAGSGYTAATRAAIPDDPTGTPWRFAEDVSARLTGPETVYILDVCESDGGLHVLELNPFSGADLYACNGRDIVREVASIAAMAV